jgi:hypothetical protein
MRKQMRVLAGLVALLMLGARPVSAEIIDRIVAVVSGQVITRSDVETALALGLVAGERPGTDRALAALQDLVDRTLMLGEVRRVVPPAPPVSEIDARLARIRSRFASPAALAHALALGGIDAAALRAYAADDLRLASYLAERFSSGAQPTDEEVAQYLRDHPELAADRARQQLAAEHRQTLVTAWIAELRRRADITMLSA